MAEVTLSVLERIRIASPCGVPWDTMDGDDCVRHCEQCNRKVYNLSALSSADAEALVIKHEGKMCAGFFRRADGTMITADCPIGMTREQPGGLRSALTSMATGTVAVAQRMGPRGLAAASAVAVVLIAGSTAMVSRSFTRGVGGAPEPTIQPVGLSDTPAAIPAANPRNEVGNPSAPPIQPVQLQPQSTPQWTGGVISVVPPNATKAAQKSIAKSKPTAHTKVAAKTSLKKPTAKGTTVKAAANSGKKPKATTSQKAKPTPRPLLTNTGVPPTRLDT